MLSGAGVRRAGSAPRVAAGRPARRHQIGRAAECVVAAARQVRTITATSVFSRDPARVQSHQNRQFRMTWAFAHRAQRGVSASARRRLRWSLKGPPAPPNTTLHVVGSRGLGARYGALESLRPTWRFLELSSRPPSRPYQRKRAPLPYAGASETFLNSIGHSSYLNPLSKWRWFSDR